MDFSFYPYKADQTAISDHSSLLFSNDPWSLIRQRIGTLSVKNDSAKFPKRRFSAKERKDLAEAYLQQAQDFFHAQRQMQGLSSRPLLQYYFAMNLVRVLVLLRNPSSMVASLLSDSYHGMSDGKENDLLDFEQWVIKLSRSAESPTETTRKGSHARDVYNVFHELSMALDRNSDLDTSFCPDRLVVSDILPQILFAHRLWVSRQRRGKDRFVRIKKIEWFQSEKNAELRFRIDDEDLRRSIVPHEKDLVKLTGLSSRFEYIASDMRDDLLYFDMYSDYKINFSQEKIQDGFIKAYSPILAELRKCLWVIVSSVPPYRKYYLYASEHRDHILPQLLSTFAVSFFFGSITRYRPHKFHQMVQEKDLEPYVAEFVHHFPSQFLYLMASEILERDVTRSAIL